MAGIKIPVEAQFDDTDVARATQRFTQQMNKMGDAIAQANKVKFNPIDRSTLEDMRKVQAQFESLLKISGGMRQRMQATGQQGSGFFDIDWARMYEDPRIRAARMRKAFEYVSAGTGAGFYDPTPAPGQGGAPAVPPPGPGASFGGVGRRIVSSGLRSAGPVGGVADSALSAGLTGGAVAGLAGLAGGLVALGISKAVGAVMNKIGDAGNEFIQYDTLKRTLGDVNVGFDALKSSLRASSDALDVTYQEGQKLGTEFAKVSGLMADQYKTLAEEVRIGGGFSRAFGLDPSAGNSFFAQMRQFQVTGNERDSRRLALLIGEAIGNSGTFSKADEMLQAIASFTAQQTRLGLTAGNAGGYAGLLSGLVGSRIPGLDPGGAANLLSRVNASIASGGGAGEAGQNFLYMALGRRLGLDPIQARILQEQGAFGTGSSTFGTGSLYARFAERFRMGTPGTAAGSSSTNLQMLMQQFHRVYAGRPELMANAMSNFFGINTSQAMALALQTPDSLGGIAGRLGRAGIDLGSVSATGIEALARINSGGRDVLAAQATSLMGRTGAQALSDEERKRLNIALMSGDDEQLRDVLTELTATREQEKTEGSETRRTIVGVQNEVQKLAGGIVPLLNDMRAGILYMAGNGEKGPLAIKEALMEAEGRERLNTIGIQYDSRISDARNAADDARGRFRTAWEEARQTLSGMTPEQQAETRKKLAQLRDEQARAEERIRKLAEEKLKALEDEEKKTRDGIEQMKRASVPSPGTATGGAVPASVTADNISGGPATSGNLRGDAWLMAELAKTDQMLGLPSGTSAAQIGQESGFNPTARSRVGARGLAQVMPETLRALEKRFGRKLNPDDPRDAVLIHREIMRENMARFGNVEDALRAYNGGWDMGNWNNDETRGYVPAIMGNRGLYSTALPPGASAAGGTQTQRVAIDGTFTLNNPNGTPAAAAVQINKQVGAPTAFGAR